MQRIRSNMLLHLAVSLASVLPVLVGSQQFVYLIQSSEPRTHPRLLPNQHRDVLYLCFARNCDVSGVPAEDVLVRVGCSWTEGRNFLLEEAIKRAKLRRDAGYLYYIFLDDDMPDVIIGDNPWSVFENFLAAHEPAVGYITDAAEWHIDHDRRDDGPVTRGQYFNVDANCNAMHRRTLGLVVPYETALDHDGIFFSSVIASYLISTLFASHRFGLNTIRANHSRNRHNTNLDVYKRSHDWDIALRYVANLFDVGGEGPSSPLNTALMRSSSMLHRHSFIDCNYAWCVDAAGGPRASVVTANWIRKHMNLQHNVTRNLLNFQEQHQEWLHRLRKDCSACHDFAPSVASLVCGGKAALPNDVDVTVSRGGTVGWCDLSDRLLARWCRNHQRHPRPPRIVRRGDAEWGEDVTGAQACEFTVPPRASRSLSFEAAIRGLAVGVEYVLTSLVTRELGLVYGDSMHPYLQKHLHEGDRTGEHQLVVFEEETRIVWTSDRSERSQGRGHKFTCSIPPIPRSQVHTIKFIVRDKFPGAVRDEATGQMRSFAFMTKVVCSSQLRALEQAEEMMPPAFGTFEDLEEVCEACDVVDRQEKALRKNDKRDGSEENSSGHDIKGGHGDEHPTISLRYGSLGRIRRSNGELNASFGVVGLVSAFQYKLVVWAEVRRCVDMKCSQSQMGCEYRIETEQRREKILTASERATGDVSIGLVIPNPHQACAQCDAVYVMVEISDMYPGLSRDEMVLGGRRWTFPLAQFNLEDG